jgi:hypothetical protein
MSISLKALKKVISQGPPSKGSVERLEVTVIPEDSVPYSKLIQIPSSLIGKT